MKNEFDSSEMIAKAIVWAAGRAIECVPVIGPVFRAVSFVNDVAEINKLSKEEDDA